MGRNVNWSALKCASKSQMKGQTLYELAFFPCKLTLLDKCHGSLPSTQGLENGYCLLLTRVCVILKENKCNSAPPPTM